MRCEGSHGKVGQFGGGAFILFLCSVLRGGVSQLNVGAEWTVGAGSAGSA